MLHERPKKLDRRHLQDTDPTVVMDINLGKRGKYIDFDYDAFRTLSKKLGGNNDNSDVTISLQNPGFLIAGSYNESNKTITLQPRRNSKKLQKTLQHEYMHHLDLAANPATKYEDIQNELGDIAMRALPIASVAMAGLGTLSVLEADSQNSILKTIHETYTTPYPIAPILALEAVAAGGYFFHKRERIARRAEKQTLPEVFTLTEKHTDL